jgi:hypothetical protein
MMMADILTSTNYTHFLNPLGLTANHIAFSHCLFDIPRLARDMPALSRIRMSSFMGAKRPTSLF